MSEKLGQKEPVRVATTANITLSGEQTIDGVVTSEDRVLVKSQTDHTQNGIYVSSSGPWTRATDFNGANDFVSGTSVFVNEGSANGGSLWTCTVSDVPPQIGVSTIVWAAFAPSAESGALTGDLAAVEALTGTGIVRRTGSDAWSTGTRVTNAELATMTQATIKGRASGAGTGDATDLTATQATAILNTFGGDSGAGGLKGLVPATVAGDSGKFLKGDGTWSANGSGDMQAANNLSELASKPTAFGTLKQHATSTATGCVELATSAEVVAGTDTSGANQLAAQPSGVVAAVNARTESLIISCSDEVTPLTVGVGKLTFRMPYALTVTDVRASLSTAQGSGAVLTVDVNDGAASILSTKLTFDNGAKTTTTASTPRVISDTALADDAEITIDIDQIGNSSAKGLKVTLIGKRP